MPSDLIREILDMNHQSAVEYFENADAREDYMDAHPTEYGALKCMDGRIHIPRITRLPPGLIKPWRNVGGQYNVGWPMMRASLNEWERTANKRRHPVLLLITYHWSEGDPHRGCKGFNYNREAAYAYMEDTKAQVLRAYKGRIWPVVMGVETDHDIITLHGNRGRMLCMADIAAEATDSFLDPIVADLLEDFPVDVRKDINPLLLGNARHILDPRIQNRSVTDFKHCERVLAIGQGFDWLRKHNFALIIGPCDPGLHKPILTAAAIIYDNFKQGRIPRGGVLLVSTPYQHKEDREGAVEQSKFLAQFAMEYIREELPEMEGFFEPLVGVLRLSKRRFEVCGES